MKGGGKGGGNNTFPQKSANSGFRMSEEGHL